MSPFPARAGRWLLVTGLVLHGSVYVLRGSMDWVSTWFYLLAWWTFIVVLEGWNQVRGGGLFGPHDPGWGVTTCLFSAIIWFVFELYNFFLGNWYYVGVPEALWLRWPAVVVAFATVLPGLWQVKIVVNRWLPGWLNQRTSWSPGTAIQTVLILTGLLFTAGPLLAPEWMFPFVWGGLLLVLDVHEYRFGRESWLGEIEQGRYRSLFAWLIAGAVCGFLWEFWNALAASGWIYTVPHLGAWRLFEMPLIGYLGFPPFALMTRRMHTVIRRYHRMFRGPLRVFYWSMLIGFSCLVLWGMDVYTVASTRIDLRDFEGWTRSERQWLVETGRYRPGPVLQSVKRDSIRQKIEFLQFAGMGTETGNCLWKEEIHSVQKLLETPDSRLVWVLVRCRGGPPSFWKRRVKDWKQRA